MPDEPVTRRLAAIVSADVAGYSRMIGRDEVGTLAALKALRREVVDPGIAAHGGRIVKTTGDGLLLEFTSVVEAVRCVVDMQIAMAERGEDVPEERRIAFRVGVNLGDIIIDGDDIFGDGVNIAARLQEIAAPGGVCISSRVYDDVRDRLDIVFEDAGPQTLKNIARSVHVWQWTLSSSLSTTAAAPPVAALALPDKPSIAVLPFQNMSGDPEQGYFAEGIAEDLITALSRVSWLFVIARNSSFVFGGEKVDIRTIGSKLGVRYLVEGSVRKSGSRIRLTAQLIEASSGNHLWADRYDGPLDQIFELQDQIIASLIGAIEPKLRATEIARASRKRIERLDAYDLLLQSLPKQALMTRESLAEAIDLLDRAVVLSPTYSEALAYGAWCRSLRRGNGYSNDPDRDFRESLDLAQRALQADPGNPVALRCAGFAVFHLDSNYEAALNLMDRSLAIDANSAIAWAWRGWINTYAGEPEIAMTEFEKAMRLSPIDPWSVAYSVGMAFALSTSGRFEEGLRWARKGLQEAPNWGAAHRYFVGALSLTGRHAEACAAAQAFLAFDPKFTVHHWVETGPFRRTPNQERLFAALREAGLPE